MDELNVHHRAGGRDPSMGAPDGDSPIRRVRRTETEAATVAALAGVPIELTTGL